MPRQTLAADNLPDATTSDEPAVADAMTAPTVHVPATASPRPLAIAVVVSCALHAAGAAALLLNPVSLSEYGVLAEQTDAISVEIARTMVLEAVEATPVESEVRAVATAPQQGRSRPAETAPEALPRTIDAAQPEAVDVTEEPLEVLRGAAAPQELEAKAVRTREAETKRAKPIDKPHDDKPRRSIPQSAGGATARSNTGRSATSGRVSASRGSIVSYAARVRAKVARNKPSGNGHRGTASVSFGVSLSGGLAYARLARSSGNAALDRAALGAVRRAAPFGAPPAGATPGQLRFSVPFYFR